MITINLCEFVSSSFYCKAYAADNEAKDYCQREIAALEEAVGLGAGWTGDQLRKQRDLRRTIEELDVDKERRQQELDQVSSRVFQ